MQADAEVSSSKKNKDDLNTDDLSGIVFELKMDLAGQTFFMDVPFILVRISMSLNRKLNPGSFFRKRQQDCRAREEIEKGGRFLSLGKHFQIYFVTKIIN